jgi:hypothetical protein
LLLALSPLFAFADHTARNGGTWRINENHCVIWNGQPYTPIGLRIQGTPENVEQARAAGVSDVIVELPANGVGWSETIAALEKANMRYLIAISSMAPMAKGIAVEPSGFRVDNITGDQTVTLNLPGATSAYVILATKHDSAVEQQKRIEVANGVFSMDVHVENTLEHVLLIYPEQASLEQPDYWEGFDEYRDSLLATLREQATGKGFRGLINPIGQLPRSRGSESRFVPMDSYFRGEFSVYLQTKYRSIETAMKSWSVTGSTATEFSDLARLIPLWYGNRGVHLLLDPVTNETYPCDKDTVWRDIEDVISNAETNRYQRLVSAIRKQSDIPVIQEWTGWLSLYESRESQLDGVGIRTDTNSPAEETDMASHGLSTVFRWQRPGIPLATSISTDPKNTARSQSDLEAMGVRGWFFLASTPAEIEEFGARLKGAAASPNIDQVSTRVLYFPEAAKNPAVAQNLPSGVWWLPSPDPGNRIDFGPRLSAYRLMSSTGHFIALWSNSGGLKTTIRLLHPQEVRITSLDGSSAITKVHKDSVELTITEAPLLISGINDEEIPVPDLALEDIQGRVGALAKLAADSHVDLGQEMYYFNSGLRGYERNPGAAMAYMSSAVRRMDQIMAPYYWIEAELFSQATFSDAPQDYGCSGDKCLLFRTTVPNQKFTAVYNVGVRSFDDQEVWVAARFPKSMRDMVRLNIGGQILTRQSEGFSPYGAGYAWYQFGTTKLAGATTQIALEVNAPNGVDLAVDAIVLSPTPFTPRGISVPENFGPLPDKAPVKKRKSH